MNKQAYDFLNSARVLHWQWLRLKAKHDELESCLLPAAIRYDKDKVQTSPDDTMSKIMAKAIDMGGYYRIPCDNRDLNYDKFFTEGDHKVETVEEYHSHNTKRLDVDGMKELLLKLNFIREDLGLQPRAKARDYRSE